MSAPEGRPFKITGADGERIDIPAGEYYFNTKARARRMMLNSLSPEARRVYACLELATMGFQRELAVVAMGGGKQRPLTRADIAKQTGFSEAHARRGLVELEDAGLAERQGIGGGPLHKGRIEIYSWANPRAAKKKKGSQRAAPIPEWFPKSWDPLKPLISRFKLKLLPELGPARGSLIQKGEEAAREYQKAEKEACALLKQVCAEPKNAAHKRKNGKNVERTESPAPPPVPVPISKESATASGRAEITTGVHTPEGGAPARRNSLLRSGSPIPRGTPNSASSSSPLPPPRYSMNRCSCGSPAISGKNSFPSSKPP